MINNLELCNHLDPKCCIFWDAPSPHIHMKVKVVLQGSPRSPDIHDLSQYHRLCDLGRHTQAVKAAPGCQKSSPSFQFNSLNFDLSNSHVRRPGLTILSPGLAPFAPNKSLGLAWPYLSFHWTHNPAPPWGGDKSGTCRLFVRTSPLDFKQVLGLRVYRNIWTGLDSKNISVRSVEDHLKMSAETSNNCVTLYPNSLRRYSVYVFFHCTFST